MFPGGQLSGPESAFDPKTVPAEAELLQLETNASEPYSVNVGFRRIEGDIYIDPAAERQWYKHIVVNPLVRIRFDGSQYVHPAQAETVTEPDVLAQFEADRIVLRLVPRE
jgi:hypothetical protein